jgi:antitoxin HicB
MELFQYQFPVELTPDDNDTLLVTCPDLPGVVTFGIDEADALRHAVDAVITMLEGRRRDGAAIPRPSPAAGRPVVTLPVSVCAKLALYETMREQGVSQVELGRRLGVDPRQVRRMLDLTGGSRFDDLEAALAALGRRPVIGLEAA